MRNLSLSLLLACSLPACHEEWEYDSRNDAPDVVDVVETYNLDRYMGLWRYADRSGDVFELEISPDGYRWQASRPNGKTTGDEGIIDHMPDKLTFVSRRQECSPAPGNALRYTLRSEREQNQLRITSADDELLSLVQTDSITRLASLACPIVSEDVVILFPDSEP